MVGLICILVGLFTFWAGYSNVEFAPLIKVIIYLFAMGLAVTGVYLAGYVDYCYIDQQKQQLIRARGLWLARRYSYYPFADIKAVDVRMASAIVHKDDSLQYNSATISYSAVIKLKGDEVYFSGSRDKLETIQHAQQLAQSIGKPLRIKTHGRTKSRAKDHEVSMARMGLLLLLILSIMAGTYALVVVEV
ncbi:hypothetical protein [Motilimonas sp. KMU-193]|uniref:hypothetical protein n=1 Tax=Motilimonas sp. KMU-193 TaxID=3388668 RepID=UPI00396B1F5F